jgi:hypothetical protein
MQKTYRRVAAEGTGRLRTPPCEKRGTVRKPPGMMLATQTLNQLHERIAQPVGSSESAQILPPSAHADAKYAC